MIQIENGIIQLHTRNTSYILSVRSGFLECLHYGARIAVQNAAPLEEKADAGFGSDVKCRADMPALSSLCLELSPANRGDYRRGALAAVLPGGGGTTEYTYQTAVESRGGSAPTGGMPAGHGADETLALSFSENSGLSVELFYTVFYEADVIAKRVRVTNRGNAAATLTRCLSSQLDFPHHNFTLYTLTGAWARECHVTPHALAPGLLQFGSTTGASGHRCNPFFFLAAPGATEHTGEVYGFNLVYSGSHEASAEVDTHGRLRILQGVAGSGFAWPLAPGESFVAPEAVLTFSEKGKNGMSQNMHHFIKRHILPPRWAAAPRPVLVNNWEGTYFNFNEAKLLGMAKVAKKLGVELFVLDDGWFGKRNSDTAGLGDYNVNTGKLPGGLKRLAQKINSLGMQFGLWFEPEMVNADSDLFRAHPDWIVQTPGYVPCTGRNQYVLDLCRPEVRGYIIESVNRVLGSANIAYVKWDMNRHISDNFSPALQNQGSFMHRYALGLYELFNEICLAHPDILFEGCSSGGNRFDLGVLAYMPQIWTSDDTDACERQKIQTGTSYGYPPCTMGCHVSAVPNHQTLRNTPLETRFNTAIFGLLGYELDMRLLTAANRQDIALQIAYYKQHRALLQYGTFYRLKSPFEEQDGSCAWVAVSANQEEALAGEYMGLLRPNTAQQPLRFAGLEEAFLYRLTVRRQKMDLASFGGLINFVSPVHLNPEGLVVKVAGKLYRLPTEEESYTAYGSLLNKAGVKFLQNFS
ncbi:MAG: alpha-galactosidase, partial [Oscillospiraceae bacterium]